MTRPTPTRLLRAFGAHRLLTVACSMSLLAMVLMCWSVLDPTPFPVMVAMSVGQVIGTLGLLCYLAAILVDTMQRRTGSSLPPDDPKTSSGPSR